MNSATITSDEEKPYRDFGRVLQDLRKKLGLNQKEMAEKLEVTHGYYGHWEQGRHRPSPKVLSRIASRYDLSQFKLDLSYLMEKAGYDEEEITKTLEDNRRRNINAPSEADQGEEINSTDAQSIEERPHHIENTPPTARQTNVSHEVDLNLLKERLEWALSCISQDPTYALPQNLETASLPLAYKVFVVKLYQTETRRNLLTPEENEALSELGPV